MEAIMTRPADKLSPESLLQKASAAFRKQRLSASGPFRVGIDLGTATCVIVVVDDCV